ncbi:ABC transporter permease [Chitinophaga sancti]|uniref:ABC transporter permease n=1 Tax=Chitinophaga sancti TaxID=1004 RepID=UPI003F78F76F
MFYNYIKIGWRNLMRQKVFSAINIVGMTVAFCVAFLLGIAAYFEWSYDQFHTNKNGVFLVYTAERMVDGSVQNNSSHAAVFGPTIEKECSAVQAASRFAWDYEAVSYKEKSLDLSVNFVDPAFLSMFSFPVLEGDKNALRQASHILITKKAADKLFPGESPIGKLVQINMNNHLQPFTIAGIMADVPRNSSISFEVLCSFQNVISALPDPNTWDNQAYQVFVQLRPHTSPAMLETQMNDVIQRYRTNKLSSMKENGVTPGADGKLLSMHTLPLADMHFREEGNTGGGINPFYPWMLVIMALLIIGTASINFINLSMGRSFTRAGEIGLRKALGAVRNQLIMQFWCEALIVCTVAFIASLVLGALLLPAFNRLFSYHLSFSILLNVKLISWTIVAFFFVTVLAGGYPAWLVARTNLIEVLKGKMSLGKSGFLRNTLIIVQFVVAVLLISSTAILWQQLNYLRTRPMGFDTEQVISVPITGNVDATKVLARIQQQLNGDPHVISSTASYMNLGAGLAGGESTWKVGFDFKGHEAKAVWVPVEYDYLQTLGLKLVAGRDFSRSYGADSNTVIVNEKLAATLDGGKDVIGQHFEFDGQQIQIIGIIKDFNFKSLRQGIGPLALKLTPSLGAAAIFVKVKPADLPGAMAAVEKAWRAVVPQGDFKGSFLNENVNRMYEAEARLATIIVCSAVLAILISCMGLFAVAVLVIGQRNREIGIRKVMGASVGSIVTLLSAGFLKLVAIAIVIASPMAWYIMSTWLQHFAYRIQIQWWLFILVGLAALIIAFFTISIQTIRTAFMNPVKSIKTA